ncbi:MAG: tetratricopeptide repeat protein [Gammaproteobacteria bacterium]|nr:tetratricopeptide repeat protein [Gammaproteobacteria bacterium]
MRNFYSELKRRNVVKVGAAYVILVWLIAQVAELALDSFDAPSWVIKTILLLSALGLPLALIFAWVFELTPEGIKREKDIEFGESDVVQTGRKLSYVIAAAAVLAVGFFIWNERDGSEVPLAEFSESSEDRSVAILPFVNMSPDPAQEYFSDGITEEIINAVVKIPGLSVPARTSVFAFRDHRGDVREIGASLDVAHVLEGSVRSQGDQVRITAQLIKVDDGFHLWSETFDRKLENIFAVQEEIAAAIAEALVGELGTTVETVPNQTRNMAAYDTYLKGRAALRNRQSEAVTLLEQATIADPDFAPAWAALAIAYQSVLENYQKGINTARKALALDANNVDALNAMGAALRQHRRWQESEKYFDKALTIDPNSAELLEDYAEFLSLVGRTREALIITRRGMDIDSRLMPLVWAHLDALTANGYHDEARQLAQEVLDSDKSLDRYVAVTYLLPVLLNPALSPSQITAAVPSSYADGTPLMVIDMNRAVAKVIEGSQDAETIEALKSYYPMMDIQSREAAQYQSSYLDSLPARSALVLAKELDYVIEHDIWWALQIDLFPHEFNWTPFFADIRTHPRFGEYLEAAQIVAYWDTTSWPDWCKRGVDGRVNCR